MLALPDALHVEKEDHVSTQRESIQKPVKPQTALPSGPVQTTQTNTATIATSPALLTQTNVQALQRAVGNQATTAYVQQSMPQPADAGDPPSVLVSQLFTAEGPGQALLQSVVAGAEVLNTDDNLSGLEEADWPPVKDAVSRVQAALIDQGCMPPIVRGDFGRYGTGTQAAVANFQSAHQLTQIAESGTVDTNTLLVLDETQKGHTGMAQADMGADASQARLDTGNGRSYGLDWAGDPAMQQAFLGHLCEYLTQLLSHEFDGDTLEAVLSAVEAYIAELRELEGDEAAAAALTMVSHAFSYAVVDTLDAEDNEHARYWPNGGETYCNIYGYDMVSALGGYLPRMWWSSELMPLIEQGARLPAEDGSHGVTYMQQMSADDLVEWMEQCGAEFGWMRAENITAAQQAANEGAVVILLAHHATDETRDGHVNIVMPEIAGRHAATWNDSHTEVLVPLQSQAGGRNFRYEASPGNSVEYTQEEPWWRTGAAWIYRGAAADPLGAIRALFASEETPTTE